MVRWHVDVYASLKVGGDPRCTRVACLRVGEWTRGKPDGSHRLPRRCGLVTRTVRCRDGPARLGGPGTRGRRRCLLSHRRRIAALPLRVRGVVRSPRGGCPHRDTIDQMHHMCQYDQQVADVLDAYGEGRSSSQCLKGLCRYCYNASRLSARITCFHLSRCQPTFRYSAACR